ncbi:subtilisin-like protease SBT1.9 [Humulus lupulus]|uniref:subtilisin-like protease SBT1.9 n=1 Tax=Humulus lupulus TaxID=3486 RepID=UPI002B40D69C|nr:subtilisin-like protease SBT1.9 [Humulus lupulus]
MVSVDSSTSHSSAMATKLNIDVVSRILLAISFFVYSVSAKSQTYIVHMDRSAMPKAFSTHQSWYMSTLSTISENSQLPISSKLIHTYTNSIHGFSVTLTPSELEALKNYPGYIHSTPDHLLKPLTTHTPKLLGLSPTSGLWPASSYGEGIIIGVVDTGIWPESKSFSDKGMTIVPSRWKGKCDSGEQFNSSLCNKKLIGARFYNKGLLANYPDFNMTMNSPRDEDGHGTHTASTAAGGYVESASYFGYAVGTASGLAPRARVAIYKTIWKNSVYSSDFLASIDQAIEDGVDILSLSLALGHGEFDFDDDSVAVATFAAMEKGIFVSAAAGNNGPRPGTVINAAPWITTVGAGTVDRDFQGTFVLGNGFQINFDSLYPGNSSQIQVRLVFLDACLDLKQMKKVRDKIVVCKDNLSISDQVENAKSAKVFGAVFISNHSSLSDFYTRSSFRAAFIGLKDGEAVINYIKKSKNPTGRLEFQKTVLGSKPAPKVDSYSSRGPSLTCPNVLKPDILAPGSSILAAWSPISSVAEDQSRSLFSDFNIDSGTSMAAPHVAGAAALIKSVHSDWSPAAIRSALITTANPLDNTQKPIQDVDNFEIPGLDTGAGHIQPNKAVDPGLIYDATSEDYVKLLCGMKYTAKQIQTITKSNHTCVGPRSLDLNYPSFIAYFNGIGGSKVVEFRRTLTNVGKENSSYSVKVTAMNELQAKVEPTKLVFKKKYEKLSYKLTLEGPKVLKADVALGSLSWVEDTGKYVVRSPIVATNIDPESLREL